VVDTKYDSLGGGWCFKEVTGPYGVGVWKSLRIGWEDISKLVKYEVRDGSMVWFWHDLWCGEQPLKFYFLELFTIAHCKDAWVVVHMQFQIENINWNMLKY
jgi:hypothetical protein